MTIQSTNSYDYKNAVLGATGAVIAWQGEPLIKKALLYPTRKYISKEISNVQGGGYKNFVEKAIKQNNLESSLKVIDINKDNCNTVKKILKVNFEEPKGLKKILLSFLRLRNNCLSSLKRTVLGKNAFFSPKDNAIVCNFSKFGAPAFHEIAHKLNSKSSNFIIKTLSKIRNPLAIFGPLIISATAILNQKKTNKTNNKTHTPEISNFIKDNCGTLATACVLPLTIEECIANIRGTKIAKNAGITGKLLDKVKCCHKLSIISYCSAALATGVAVKIASKVSENIANIRNKNT